MTANVVKALAKIQNADVFNKELFFVGGTALSYYVDHRISEDIDIISPKTLDHHRIISAMSALGATKIQDEHVTALRLAGLFPDEYMIKFVIDSVKLEFFQATRPIQQKILKTATYTNYKDTNIKVLDLKSIAKLKIVALMHREKSRDLFDFGEILEHDVLSISEVLEIIEMDFAGLLRLIQSKKEPLDDEAVYLSEENKLSLSFDEIKQSVLFTLKDRA